MISKREERGFSRWTPCNHRGPENGRGEAKEREAERSSLRRAPFDLAGFEDRRLKPGA